MAWRDAWRIVIVILGTRRGNGDSRRAVLRWRTRGQGRTQGGEHAPAEEASLDLLVSGQAGQIYWGRRVGCERNGARNQPAVITPVEAEPRAALPGLVLDVSGLIEFLVVVDAKGRDIAARCRARRNGASATKLWVEKARGNAGKNK